MVRLCAAMLLMVFVGLPASAREIVDSAGRHITIPDRIERVFAAGPPAAILLYIVAPETLTGWPRALRAEERDYIAPAFRDLPETGRLTGRGDTTNLEVLLATKPDLILDFGSIGETYRSLADAVQEQTGIPYILIDGRFEATPDALRLVGDVLGRSERGAELAAYAEKTFRRIKEGLADIDDADRPRVYLARGPAGLETGLKGSINAEIIEWAGGRNVADPGDGAVRRGIADVAIEQVIIANPDTIITWDANFFAGVWQDRLWADIDAVRQGRVYLSPTAPFGWIDRPPSINRLIGLSWLAGIFHPQDLAVEMQAEIRRFYRLFYHVDLDDAALAKLMTWQKDRR